MSKAIEARLLDTIIHEAQPHVKGLVEKMESGAGAEELIEAVHELSQSCFAPVLEAVLETAREEVEQAPVCADCGQRLRNKGVQRRGMLTPLGHVHWRRRYYYCEGCRQGHYPLDEYLGIEAGQFTARYQEGMAMLGSCLPFAQAAALFTKLTGVSVSDRELNRTTEEHGARLTAQRLKQQQHWLDKGPEPKKPQPDAAWGVSLDAAKVRFRDGWHEVHVGVVFPLKDSGSGDGRAARGSPSSYVAEVGKQAQAGEQLYAEAIRRRIDPGTERVVCIADGASGNWTQFAQHFGQRVEILDWYHATQHLWKAASGVWGEGTPEADEWEKELEKVLWEGQPETVLSKLCEAAHLPGGKAAAEQCHYFDSHGSRMAYDEYREAGYPIGSGTVESGCKQVIIARACQAGMSWKQDRLQSVLSLRAELISDRWDEAWSLAHPLAA